MKAPAAPDPKETAAAQGAMNRETAMSSQQMNMVNQVTPYGNLTYSQNGQAFTPSDTGQKWYYNPTSGQYQSSAPISGYSTAPAAAGSAPSGDNVKRAPGGTAGGGSSQTPIYEDGWEERTGFMTPQYTATTTLNDAQQGILNQTQRAQGSLATTAADRAEWLGGYLGKEMDTSGLPALQGRIGGGYSGDIGGSFRTSYGDGYTTDLGSDWQTKLGDTFKTSYAGADDFSADRQRYEDAVRSRMAPQLETQRRNLETQLVGRGLRPGTAAWDSEMARMSRSEQDADISAILAGGDEQARMVGMSRDAAVFGNESEMGRATFGNNALLTKAGFGNDAIAGRFAAENAASMGAAGFRNDAALTSANFNNAARSQGMQEAYAARNQPLNEIAALLSGSQVTNPNFVNTPQTNVAGVDYAGMVGDKYKAESANHQAKMGGLFGLAAAPFSMFSFGSDRRLKEDIKAVGKLDNGLTVYRYRYKGDLRFQIGLMADEVEDVHPEAVGLGEHGFKMVNYARAVEAA